MKITWRSKAAVFAVLTLGWIGWGLPTANASSDGEEGCLHGRLERAEFRNATIGAGEFAKDFDESTGRDLRHFPPDRLVDYRDMKLEMRFDDLNERKFSAFETLTFVPIGRELGGLKLDAARLKINSVKLLANGEGAKPVEYSSNDTHLMLRFDPPLPPEKEQKIVIDYVCERPIDGLFFTPYSPEAPHYSAEVHTQGESETNRHWFVCHDFPNERMSTELIVDVPAEFSVSSNGRLVSHLTSGNRAVWHYRQEKPHVSYLVTLIIGKFDIVEIPSPKSMPKLPMKVWVPQGLGDQVLQTYGRTGEMIDMFNEKFGVQYPWDRYDQLCAKNFHAGGMENTSATTMYPTAILDKNALLDSDLDGLISHELCHQWAGDFITCKSWAHIWLNEGWATYGSAMWNEHRYGIDGYLDSIRGSFGVANRDKTSGELPMVSPIYDTPDETFRRAPNPYPKGSSILHMLRMMLGDDVFWKGVRLYFNRHGLGVAETNDFRYAMEEVSGKGLEWFFEQWCYRPGCPELKVNVEYNGESRELAVNIEQTQKIDARTPAFRFTLPIVARTESGEKVFNIDVTEKTTSFRTTLDGPPSQVVVDPYLHVLKTITEEKPLAMWVEQAKNGPTIAARHAAIETLGKTDSPEHIALLSQIIRNDKERYTLRNSAVSALAKYASAEAKDALLSVVQAGVAEAKVRSNLVGRLSKQEKEKVLEMLAEFAANDPSYATRVAAIEGLAALKAKEKADLIAGLVDYQSQHDQVRSAALRALADLDYERGLDLAIKYSAYGFVDRSRPSAISTVRRLAKHNQERAVDHLLALLRDPELRSMTAAGNALAELSEEKALEPLRDMAVSHHDPETQRRAGEWVKRIEEKRAGNETPAAEPPRTRRRQRAGE